MTDMTDDQVRALLDGATPGPWRADGEPWNRIVWSSADNRVCFMAHSSGLNDARDTATSNLVAAAPDLARALLDARADAQAAVALMVERAGKVLRDTEVPAEWTSEGAIQRRALNYAATVLDALAPDAGTAELARLRERAEKAEQERDRIDQWRETAIVERDTYSEERDAADGRVAALTEALGDMVGLFSADNVLRKGTHMNATLKLARAPAAQTPTDPGDGWTWNERLGWIGPDGKPADPRRG